MSIDFFPTILEMTATAAPADVKIDGTSLAPVLRDASETPREASTGIIRTIIPAERRPTAPCAARDWKLIEFYEDQHVELYNLADDLGETRDLAGKCPRRPRELRNRWQPGAWRSVAQMPTPNPNYDPGAPLFPPAQSRESVHGSALLHSLPAIMLNRPGNTFRQSNLPGSNCWLGAPASDRAPWRRPSGNRC